jgi:NTE family protein
LRRTILLFVAFSIVFSVYGQQLSAPLAAQAKPSRPRLGLALSGGSALGIAHVGVLQWLEEHRIPINNIGGTSMGGLVAGLFATGQNAAEMRQFIASIDWSTVFDPTPPFRDLAFRRKEDARDFPNKLELGITKKVRLPPGLSSGQEVGLVLSRFAAPYAEYRNFDDLPTPFRCIATNLADGKEVVFKEGSLPVALRATMSLPAIFAPVRVDDMLLADGGLLNNIPVDVVRQMGSDIVVAVTLEVPPLDKESMASILGVSKRSISVMIEANERRSMALADLLVSPDLTGLTGSDFTKYEEFMKRGYEAAEKKKALLTPFAVSEEEYAQYVEERQRKRLPKNITPTFVAVEGLSPAHDKAAERMEKDLVGKPLDSKAIAQHMNEIAGLGPYQSAVYGFAKKDGAEGIDVDVLKKTYGPPFLNTGINIEGSNTANIRFGAGGRLTFEGIGSPGAELRTEFTLGLNNSIFGEYYRPLKLSRWFVAPYAYYSHRQEDVYTGDQVTNTLRVKESHLGFDFGRSISRFQEVRVGYLYDYINPTISAGAYVPSLSQKVGDLHVLRTRWVYDSEDSNLIPRHGVLSTLNGKWNFGTPSGEPTFGVVEEQLEFAKSFSPRYVAITTLNGGTIIGPRAYLPPFELGGPGNLSAFAREELRGNRYYLGSVQGLRAFSEEPTSFMHNVFLDVGFEAGNAFNDLSAGKPQYDGLFGIVGASPVGIFFVGGSYGTSSEHKFFFRIGRLF